MSGYIGPIPVPQGIQNKETFTATAGQTTFNTNGYTDGAFISVYLNGVRLVNGTDYTSTNGSDVVLASGANAGDVLDFETFNSFSLASQQFENITTKNPTHEDTDGGRESAISFKGEQSGGEISTLAQIQASHDGTSDDQKGDLIFKTNDGSDNDAPTERLRIDSAGSIITATLGTNNTHLGEGAAASIASGGNNNTVIGYNAGNAITTGDKNTALGVGSLQANTTGENNTAIGYNAGTSITTGTVNTFVGNLAGDAVTTAHHNTGVGHQALTTNVLGSNSVAVGSFALNTQNPASAADMDNTGVGYNAGAALTTGTQNTLIGSLAGDALTTASGTTAIGKSAMSSGAVTGDHNTAVGYLAGDALTSGVSNTFVGTVAGDATTTGNYNVAVGRQALSDNSTGGNNTAIGYVALENVTTGNHNTTLGSHAGFNVTTERNNVFVGSGAGYSTTGGGNCFFGGYGSNNGVGSGYYMTSGDDNVIIGGYTGNNDSIDIRTQSDMIVISDGDGYVKQIYWSLDGNMYMRQGLRPWTNNGYPLGGASNKWSVVYANTATINTSDENEKQQIASLTSAEITAATAISKLFKTYKWNDAVESKGDAARTHTGVIAQQVEAAMTDAGLDASKYGFWCSDTWWTKDREVEAIEAQDQLVDEEGQVIREAIPAQEAYTFTDKWENEEDAPDDATKHTVKGIRYEELFAFVCAASEQRLTSIEARLDALEAE